MTPNEYHIARIRKLLARLPHALEELEESRPEITKEGEPELPVLKKCHGDLMKIESELRLAIP